MRIVFFLRYVHDVLRWRHIFHHVPTIFGVLLATHSRKLLKALQIRYSCYLYTLFHFASSTRTGNLFVTTRRSIAMGHLFTVRQVGCGILYSFPHRIKNKSTLERTLERFVELLRTHYI
jgi:hypothetical protein